MSQSTIQFLVYYITVYAACQNGLFAPTPDRTQRGGQDNGTKLNFIIPLTRDSPMMTQSKHCNSHPPAAIFLLSMETL